VRKKKGPSFTYPRIPLGGKPLEKNEELPQRLGGRALFSLEFSRMLQGVLASRPKLSILELGAGSGDLSRLMVDAARSRKCAVRVMAVEFSKGAVEAARARSRDYPEIDFVMRSLPDLDELRSVGFDLTVCGFALHLFPIEQAIGLLKTIDRTARAGWIVTDFRRSRWLTMLAEALGSWFSKNGRDLRQAVALTQQAFTGREMKNLAFHAGIADYEWRGWFLLHQTLIRVKR